MDQPKYHIDIFWSDEDGGYIANVPDLEYCSAFGETYEEALREVLVAMALHLDTLKELERSIPQPTSHQESEIEVVGYSSGQVGQGIVVKTGDDAMEFRTDEVAGSAGQKAREALETVRQMAEQAMEAISEADALQAEVSRSGFPIPNYDEFNVEEVTKVLDGLTAAELREVREYEKRNKSRETLIEQLDRRLGA